MVRELPILPKLCKTGCHCPKSLHIFIMLQSSHIHKPRQGSLFKTLAAAQHNSSSSQMSRVSLWWAHKSSWRAELSQDLFSAITLTPMTKVPLQIWS